MSGFFVVSSAESRTLPTSNAAEAARLTRDESRPWPAQDARWFHAYDQIYDTTLRDGTQGEGVSLSLLDKLQITERLDQIGVDYIEGGYPLSNEKDIEYFRRVQNSICSTPRCALSA